MRESRASGQNARNNRLEAGPTPHEHVRAMNKPAKSQWDFGELFPPAETRKVLSVWELTSEIKRLLEKQIGSVWVSGEITNLRAQSSGHIYCRIDSSFRIDPSEYLRFRRHFVPQRYGE